MTTEIHLVRSLGYAPVMLDSEGYYSPHLSMPFTPDPGVASLPDKGVYQIVNSVDDLMMGAHGWRWRGLGEYLSLAYYYARLELEVGATLYLQAGGVVTVIINRQYVTPTACVRDLSIGYDPVADTPIALTRCHPLGTIHSHHRMAMSYSGTDDEQGMQLPGLHLLVRRYPRPLLDVSLYSNTRYYVSGVTVGISQGDLMPQPLTPGLAEWLGDNVTVKPITIIGAKQ